MAAWNDVFSMAIVVGVLPYYDADFGWVETGLGPVVRTLIDAGLMCSPVRTGLISSPVEASYPCSLGLVGSTSHLINK